MQMPDQTQNLLMPHARPGTDKVRKCPAVARGAGGGAPGRSWIQLKHYVRIQPKKISPTK